MIDALPEGSLLQDGAYIIERALAQSAFSITYVARDAKLRRIVALKEYYPSGCRRDSAAGAVLPAALLSREEFENGRARFVEEARALAPFHHPHIVAVHTFFEEHNTAYMVMEYLQGRTLLQVLEERGRLPEPEVLRIAAQLCDALEAVHAANRLHRDLKPDNVMLTDDNRVVLLDFGLSTRVVPGDTFATRQLDEALRFGTPGYAPLEQYTQSGEVSAATDVYALGATLYHLLTGRVVPAATDRAFGTLLESPCALSPAVSIPVSDAILWALRMKPESRPPSAHDFAERLWGRDHVDFARARFLRVLLLRIATLTRLEAEKRLLQQAASVVSTQQISPTRTMTGQPPPTVVLPQKSTQPLPNEDDSGCFQVAFIAYLIIWLIAAVACATFFFVRLVMFGL